MSKQNQSGGGVNKSVLALFGVVAPLVIAIGVLAIVVLGGGSKKRNNGDTNTQNGSGSSDSGSASADLRLLGGDPLTLDPALASDSGSAAYIVEIFGGLVTLDQNLRSCRTWPRAGTSHGRQDLHVQHPQERQVP